MACVGQSPIISPVNAVQTHDLTKRYGPRAVLRDVNLTVPAGSLFGFLGPNGAGKTTAIRILMGLLRASAGQAEVLGHDSWHAGPAARAQVGYLPGEVRFYGHLTGRATLTFIDRVRRSRAAAEIDRLTQRFDLELDKRVRAYSRGMKQKLGLIAALMHRPRLLILDEPTTSLDPLVREVLYEELRRVAADGRTVLFSSHTLAEVQELCDRVAILRDGQLIEQERTDVLREKALRHVELRFRDGALADATPPGGLRVTQRTDRLLVGNWSGAVAPLLGWLSRVPVEDFTIAPPDLQDLFMSYYERAAGARLDAPDAANPAPAALREGKA